LVVEEEDAAGLGERQAGGERPAIERHLLQGVAVGLVVGFEPAGFREQAAALSHRRRFPEILAPLWRVVRQGAYYERDLGKVPPVPFPSGTNTGGCATQRRNW
jgi:hypothetical protein